MAFETHLRHPQRGGQIVPLWMRESGGLPPLQTLKYDLRTLFTQLKVI